MSSKKQILSTALLEDKLVAKAAESDIGLECIQFIEIEHSKDEAVCADVMAMCNEQLTAVFTSVNAVNAVADIIKGAMPQWSIYCVGNATKKAVLDHFVPAAIKGVANDASALAEVIIKSGEKEVAFFCGDKRMDILPELLANSKVAVKEVEVYRTKETPQKVARRYDGILFFSPSGVSSFFGANEIDKDVVLFAIGKTTAAAIKNVTGHQVIISDVPSKNELAYKAIKYFKQQATVKE